MTKPVATGGPRLGDQPHRGWPNGVERHLLTSVESTNCEAERLARRSGAPVWVLAERQTAGRGRRGREWQSLAGNFHASHACHLDCPPSAAAWRSFAAALALRDALMVLCPASVDIAFKWPNDLLIEGRKLAGILLECRSDGDATRLIIGFGVNLVTAPPTGEDGGLPAISLLESTGCRLLPASLLDALAACYRGRECDLNRCGFPALRDAWQSHAIGRGGPVVAQVGARQVRGLFTHVDETGRAVIRTDTGIVELAAADRFRLAPT